MNIKDVWKEITGSFNFKGAAKRTGQDVKYLAIDMGLLLVRLWVYGAASAILGAVVFKIVAVGGIEAVLAQLMAVTCINNARIPCDFQSLLAGTGLTLVILTGLAIAIMREVVKMEAVPYQDIYEPSREYSGIMAKTLRDIQELGGLESLHAFTALKGIPWSTMRRYIDKFERDGYVTVHGGGKGKPLEVRLT